MINFSEDIGPFFQIQDALFVARRIFKLRDAIVSIFSIIEILFSKGRNITFTPFFNSIHGAQKTELLLLEYMSHMRADFSPFWSFLSNNERVTDLVWPFLYTRFDFLKFAPTFYSQLCRATYSQKSSFTIHLAVSSLSTFSSHTGGIFEADCRSSGAFKGLETSETGVDNFPFSDDSEWRSRGADWVEVEGTYTQKLSFRSQDTTKKFQFIND